MANAFAPAFKARRDALREREAGFTLIELLVVVIIIGILAAIAIPIYIGVQNNAKDSAVKSDLVNEKTALVAAATDYNGVVPASVTAGTATVNGGVATFTGVTGTVDLAKYGWSKSTNTSTITYSLGTGSNAGLWCVLATSSTSKQFVITPNTQVVSASACPTVY